MKTDAKNRTIQKRRRPCRTDVIFRLSQRALGQGFHYLPANKERRAKATRSLPRRKFLETVFKVQVRDTRLSLTQDGGKDPQNENNFAREKLSWKTRPTLEQLETMCFGKSTLIFNPSKRMAGADRLLSRLDAGAW